MGRRMFSGGEGPWEDDPKADAWWGDEPPFHQPVFVLTHHAREPVTEAGRHDVHVRHRRHRGGARAGARGRGRGRRADRRRRRGRRSSTSRAGLVDEVQIHLVPLMLGDGVRLFTGHLDGGPAGLECTRIVESPTGVAHLRYRVPR